MKMKNRLHIALFVLLVGCGAKDPLTSVKATYVLDDKPPHLVSEILESAITTVALQLPEDNFMGQVEKVIVNEDTLFVFNFAQRKGVKVFNNKGQFLFDVGRIGRGRGEYLEARNFTTDDQYIYIIDNYSSKLWMYAKSSGKYVGYKELPIVVDDIARLDDGTYLCFVGCPLAQTKALSQDPYRLFVLDEKMNIKERMFAYGANDCDVLTQLSAFSVGVDSVVCSFYANDTIALFDRKKYAAPSIQVLQLRSNSPSMENKHNLERLSSKKYLKTPLFQFENYFVGSINQPQEPFEAFVYDTKQATLFCNPSAEDFMNKKTLGRVLLNVVGADSNRIISYIDDPELYAELASFGFGPLPDIGIDNLHRGNPVLLFSPLKKRAE